MHCCSLLTFVGTGGVYFGFVILVSLVAIMVLQHRWMDDVHRWETDDAEVPGLPVDDADWDHPNLDTMTPAEMAEEFIDMIVSLKRRGRLSAKEACIICFWATGAGSELSKPSSKTAQVAYKPYLPEEQTGHYSRHFDSVTVPAGSHNSLSPIEVPVYNKYDGSRSVEQIYAAAAHELLAQEVADNPQLHHQLEAWHSEDQLPQTYFSSPVVARHGNSVFPVVLYLDGVKFTRTDSVQGVFLYNLLSQRRFLVAAVRKGQLCRCGCRGYCTLFPVLLYIRWCLDAMATGRSPSNRHDNTPFFIEEAHRERNAGLDMNAIFMLLFVKGDWGEFGPTLSFPTLSHLYHPCMLCRSPKEGLFELDGFNPVSMPYGSKSYRDLEDACAACEIRISITADLHVAIRSRLTYDRRRVGLRGRFLMQAVPGTDPPLLRGDRLEPSIELTDIGEGFDNLSAFPTTVTFWRVSRETFVYHRIPLWSPEIGATHDRCLAIDWMHSLSLGFFQSFLLVAIHRLISLDAWCTGERTEEGRLAASTERIRNELTVFYREQRAAGVAVTEVTDLNNQSFGTQATPSCGFKAAETNHFIVYLHQCLERFQDISLVSGPSLLAASASLQNIRQIILDHPIIITATAAQAISPIHTLFARPHSWHTFCRRLAQDGPGMPAHRLMVKSRG